VKSTINFSNDRLNHSEIFINEAQNARKHLYEYAVIRVVPRVEREEFLNVGCSFVKKAKFIKMIYTVNETKLALFSPDFECEQLQHFRLFNCSWCQRRRTNSTI
jgi:hypothetical protein